MNRALRNNPNHAESSSGSPDFAAYTIWKSRDDARHPPSAPCVVGATPTAVAGPEMSLPMEAIGMTDPTAAPSTRKDG